MERPLFLRLGLVGSTQDEAATLPIGSVVVAEAQSAGRGRLGRRWDSPSGAALLATFVCAPHPLASLAAGVAAAEACGPPVRLKWPNDLLVGDRKVGGILVEARPGRCLVGIGINRLSAPEGAARLAIDRDELLDRLHARLQRWFDASGREVVDRWRQLSASLGRRVRVELPGEVYEGVAEDIMESGALVVSGRSFAAGDVIHLRPGGRQPPPEPVSPALEGPPRSGPG